VQKKEKINFIGIGVFIFIGILLFGFIIYFAGKFGYRLSGGYKLNVVFKALNNLSPGHKVSISGGMVIGTVDEILLEGDHLVAVLKIDGVYKLNSEAAFHIYSTSLVGMQYVNVSGYNPDSTNFYKDGEYIRGVDPFGMSELFEVLGKFAGDALESGEGQEALSKVGKVFQDLGEMISSLNEVVKNSQKNIEASLKNLDDTFASTAKIMKKLETTADKLDEISENLVAAMKTIDKDKVGSIVGNVDATMIELKKFATSLNELYKNENSVIYLLKDKEFSDKLKKMVINLEEFSKILKDNPNAIIFGN